MVRNIILNLAIFQECFHSWVNFYTEWNYDTNDITAIVCIDYPDRTEEKYWELTDYEKDFFKKKMDEYCIKLTGMNMKSL